jgi:Uri superfamily endonuclease
VNDFTVNLSGEPVSSGCYLLIIQLDSAQKVTFGRFNQGDAISLPAGTYLYVGSARGERGSSSLGLRLMRHATRCDPANPHAIRKWMQSQLQDAGIKAIVPLQKRCHWHIDYLLELPQAELSGVIIIGTRGDLEAKLADKLAALPETSIPARGLGASDHQGGTHLFYLQNDDWREKVDTIIQDLVIPDDGLTKI